MSHNILQTKMPLKFCANLTTMFSDESGNLLGRYRPAAESGFKGVECAFPYDSDLECLARAKDEAGVEQVLINAPPGRFLGLAANAGREEFRSSIETALEYCKKLNCKRLHIMSGTCPGTESALRSNLGVALPMLEEAGVVGLLEPINTHSLPGYFLHDYELAESIVREFDSPNLKLQLDVFHLQQLRGNLTRNIKKYLPIAGHVQIAQVPDRHEPDSSGEVDYGHVLRLLEELGYDGWIGLEYFPAGGTREGLAWMQRMGYSNKRV